MIGALTVVISQVKQTGFIQDVFANHGVVGGEDIADAPDSKIRWQLTGVHLLGDAVGDVDARFSQA